MLRSGLCRLCFTPRGVGRRDGRQIQQVPAGPDGSDRQTNRVDATPQPQHVNVEGVASRGAVGPTRLGQMGTSHHGAKASDQSRHDAGFHRGQRHPPPAEPHHAVVVDAWHPSGRCAGPATQGGQSAGHLVVLCRQTHPVLEHVVAGWGRRPRGDQEQPGEPDRCQLAATLISLGPLHQLHVDV